jgi:hypothetical protein
MNEWNVKDASNPRRITSGQRSFFLEEYFAAQTRLAITQNDDASACKLVGDVEAELISYIDQVFGK